MSEELFDFREINCPVCGNNDTKFLGWRGGEAHHNKSGVKTAVVRCRVCSHQYPNPMPFPKDDNLDELYVDAEEYFHGHDVEYKKNLGLDLMKDFEKKLGRRGRYLDVGCAAGEFLWAAKQSGWEYEGVDPSSEFVELGRKHLGVEGRVCLLEEAKFPDEYFDAVSMSSVLEHVYDPLGLMLEVRRVLRPGGYFYFDAPNEDGLYMKAGNLYMRLQRRDWVVTMAPTFPPYHVQGFNPKSLRHLLERADFELKELIMFGGVWELTGEKSLRKKIEYRMARCVTWVGNRINQGPYMTIWSRKPENKIDE
jgi:SAM-dependent methyltransferase